MEEKGVTKKTQAYRGTACILNEERPQLMSEPFGNCDKSNKNLCEFKICSENQKALSHIVALNLPS